MGQFQHLCLLFHTIRYLSPRQVLHRLWRMVRTHWRKLSHIQAPQPSGCRLQHYQSIYTGLSDIGNTCPWQAQQVQQSLAQAKQVSQLHFTFLQHSHVFHEKVLWEDPNLSQLWRYHLHYFDYVNDLFVWKSLGHGDQAYQAFRMLADSWIEGNQGLTGDGWHPYTISLRIVNWLNAVPVFQPQLSHDKEFYDRFVSSIYGQGRILAHDLEFDVRGNHLLKNLKAVIWLGVAFKGSEAKAWLGRALALLELELAEQVLADGGHFERAPGYHLIVLRDCLEICLFLRRNQQEVPQFLEDALRSMLDYLVELLPPDGKAPLIKDTTWDAGSLPWDLLTAGALYLDDPGYKFRDLFGLYPLMLYGKSGWSRFRGWALNRASRESAALPNSGYYIMRDGESGDYLIFDAGKPCPDYLPAHAHADMFSFELMVGGQRVVVDSGVFEYTQGKWRDFFRSTRAHNTVEVGGTDQSEVWDSFRVARRARPGKIKFDEFDTHIIIDAQHDGYQKLGCRAIHRRVLVWGKKGFWFVFDEIMGKGCLQTKNHLHFHPSCELAEIEPRLYRVAGPSETGVWIQEFGNASHEIIRGQEKGLVQGWYSEKFGEKVPNSVLTLQKRAKPPFAFGYVLHQIKGLVVEYSQTEPRSHHLTLKSPDGCCVIHVEPDKVRLLS